MAMPSQGFLLVWADGETNQGPLHAPFRLNADGEAVLLSVAGPVTSVTLHSLPFGPQHEDISYGLLPDGQTNGPIYMTPTPAASNVEPEPGPLAVVAAVLAIVLRR
jgi:hypothetical protein